MCSSSLGIKQKLTGTLKIDDETFNELQRKWQQEKDELTIKISELSSNSNDKITKLSILTDFANRIPELYLKANPQEKRLILATITDSVLYDSEKNILKVKLKPIFEYLRQLKLQNKQDFSADLEILNRTLETRSEKAKATLKNHSFKIDQMTEYRTLKTITNTKIQPHFEERQKTNVVRGT